MTRTHATDCFVAGTLIATPAGEVPVEALRIGDRVETQHGGICEVKWIGRQIYHPAEHADGEAGLPIRILADALDDGVPARDLLVSPNHGIGVDGGLVPAVRLVNGVTIRRETAPQAVEYLHVDLDEHEVLFANGCPAESFFDESERGLFENAVEFYTLYPVPLPFPRSECLPRLEAGFVLQAIQHRLAERAGLRPSETIEGPLRGFVDVAGPATVAGWAQCETQPEEPVCLDIFVDGIRVLRTLANRYREDLRNAGIGSGNHSFSAQLPEDAFGKVEVRRTIDQTILPLTDAAAGWAG
jgi:hypothetical protein